MSNQIGPLVFHEFLGQYVRNGGCTDHCTSTYYRFQEAIEEGRWDDACVLAQHTIDEAREPFELYMDWIPAIRQHLHKHGISRDVVAATEARYLTVIYPKDQHVLPPQEGWDQIGRFVDETVRHCTKHRATDAEKALETSRTLWLDTHDRLCDWVQAMLAIAADQLGEDSIGELWDHLMSPMFSTYNRFDIDRTPWSVSFDALLQLTTEALRGHLSGPDRTGTMELVQEDDRVGFRFRPCGSGGRNYTGDTFGSYPRTTERHDWSWNLKGVCLYCAHCCALSERNPIQRFGYPARVVDPPFDDGSESRAYCTWWVYRDPSKIPDEVYRRTGHRKPERIGGNATQTAQRR